MVVSKYNASGNDFVIFHTFSRQNRSLLAQKLCHRNSGIGADGMIVLLPHDKYDFEWEFYNSDGSLADMCANGSRAAALYAFEHELASEKMSFLTGAGVISAHVEAPRVSLELTNPIKIREPFQDYGLWWSFYDTGVPHLVCECENIDTFDKEIAQQMRHKYNANVNFATKAEDALFVRTYERGVEDETGACGTGMAASFLALKDMGKLGNFTKVYPTSKEELFLELKDGRLFFQGVVSYVFDANLKQ